MKKFFAVLMSLIMIFAFSTNAMAAPASESIEVYRNLIKLEVNGNRVNVDNFLYNGTTYVPLRAVSELLNKDVIWNMYDNLASINDKSYKIKELSKLLPDSKGFKWNYDGFAEYSHMMKIDNIIDKDNRREYIISGEVGDPSGGESNIDRNIKMEYIIEGNKLIQKKTEKAMMDSKFDSLTLIQTPLIIGNYWEEEVMDKKGNKTTIEAYINKVEINDGGNKEYTVRYDDENSPYYEIRTIEENRGVINFEKLLELEDSSFPVSYFLYKGQNVNQIEVKLYFPDRMAEKLHLEKRILDVPGMAVGRASINALIDGPKNVNLRPSIPSGTQLLNIYIKNGTGFVNFSQEFIKNHSGGSAGELMTLYSVVNTLTEYKSIDRVQILVEGEKGKTLGNILLNRPLERDPNLIK